MTIFSFLWHCVVLSIFLESLVTASFHLLLAFPTGHLPYNFPSKFFFFLCVCSWSIHPADVSNPVILWVYFCVTTPMSLYFITIADSALSIFQYFLYIHLSIIHSRLQTPFPPSWTCPSFTCITRNASTFFQQQSQWTESKILDYHKSMQTVLLHTTAPPATHISDPLWQPSFSWSIKRPEMSP